MLVPDRCSSPTPTFTTTPPVSPSVDYRQSESYQEQITLFYDTDQRTAFLRHLCTVLVSETDPRILPLAIASEEVQAELDCCPDLERTTIGVLLQGREKKDEDWLIENNVDQWDDVLCLHLTSGSTGFPKAVALTHGNVLSASAGKSAIHKNTPETRFLNWLRMDHAAGLVEFHIRPMFTRADQIQIPSRILHTDPLIFLRVLSHAQIDHAFGPMYFLSALLRALKRSNPGELDSVKLQNSLRIVSGGEAVNTTTCTKLVRGYLAKLGAPDNVIIPAYGLTESCAGFCFNFSFPASDIALSRPIGAHGLRNPETPVRIVSFSPPHAPLPPGTPGEIQLSGPIIFKKYWNNPSATSKTFSSDGWLKTGDTGYLTADPDSGHMGLEGDDGRLLAVLGRDRDSLVIGGKKYALETLISHIQDAEIEGLDPLWCTVFPIDQADAHKGFVLIFRPTYNSTTEPNKHAQTVNAIYQLCVDWSPLRPHMILAIQEEQFVPKTTMGKLSRFKMREMYLAGKFRCEEAAQAGVLRNAVAESTT